MKKIIKSAMLLLCGAVLFTACSDDNDSNPTLLQPTTFTLNTPSYSSVLIDLARSTGIPFTWSQPDYGFPVEAEYQLQASKDGNFTVNLSDVDEEHYTDANYVTLKAYYNTPEGSLDPVALNNAINQMNGWDEDNPAPESAPVYVRATATTKGAPVIYSNVVAINVSPTMEVVITYPEFIYEIGNESEWKVAYPMRSPNLDGLYQSYNYLDGGFKFKPNADNWDGDWGQDPNGTYGSLVVDGEEDCNKTDGSFQDKLLDPGFYQIDVNIIEMTWSVTAVKQVSIIGDFNGWSDDVDMTYNVEEGCWIGNATVTDGGLKFRMNHDWTVSWGLRDAGSPDLNDLTQDDGANIPVAAGTYQFKLYLTYEGNNRVEIIAQ
mgnify:CR=1 FL=1